ncbi:MAG: HNH endonuclease [Clostridia bacterium]|nr:HNH endonuclease [Clostridia bacterium]
MNKDNPIWKTETIAALKDLGGVAHLDDIFDKIAERNNIDFSNSKTPKKTLSRVLQTFSQSTKYGIDNTFYCFYGVSERKGVWGLVDNNIPNDEPSYTQEDDCFIEGRKKLRQHIICERNQQLIKSAKQRFKDAHNNNIFCEVCGFDFYKVYGKLGEDFIEAHHIKPVSEMKDNEKTDINDIVMVCSNCHSMIHRERPWLTRETLKTILNK